MAKRALDFVTSLQNLYNLLVWHLFLAVEVEAMSPRMVYLVVSAAFGAVGWQS
jgi:hypothetical protein